MSPIRLLSLIAAITVVLPTNAQTNAVRCQSSERRTVLVELYTSEGCSSCPPAEAWLSRLKESTMLWKDFVPLAFHVDYWDYLGWRDPWSSGQFTQRQRDYSKLWRSDSIYTPGFVLNGREWRAGALGRTIPTPTEAKVGVLKLSSADTNKWQASFAPTLPVATNYQIHAALLVSDMSSDVKAGENQGRTLTHDFVVLKWVKSTLPFQDGAASGEFNLVLPPSPARGRFAIAAWITQDGQMEPVQATGCWLTGANDTKNELPKQTN